MFFSGGFFLGSSISDGGGSGGGSIVKWKFESLANTRGVSVDNVTVPEYDVVNDKIMVSIAGVEMSTSDFTKTNSTKISFPDPVLNDEDIEIWNFGIGGFARQTNLEITGHVVAGSVFSVVGSGTNYTMTGQNGYLKSSADGFNSAITVQIYLNGLIQKKGVEVIWNSDTSFVLNKNLDIYDNILILS